MGVAALVLGIISLIIGFIPLCGVIAFVPAIIGIILGIVEIVKKSKASEPKGMGIAGLILSSIAVIVIIWWIFIAGGVISSTADSTLDSLKDAEEQIQEYQDSLDEYDYNY